MDMEVHAICREANLAAAVFDVSDDALHGLRKSRNEAIITARSVV